MLLVFFIIDIMAHTNHAPHWATDTWTWICHHVFLTVLILIFGA